MRATDECMNTAAMCGHFKCYRCGVAVQNWKPIIDTETFAGREGIRSGNFNILLVSF